MFHDVAGAGHMAPLLKMDEILTALRDSIARRVQASGSLSDDPRFQHPVDEPFIVRHQAVEHQHGEAVHDRP